MKVGNSETARDMLFLELLKADGDRNKAAQAIGVSARTFNRNIQKFNMYDDMERMGWVRHQGPPRTATPYVTSTVGRRILTLLKDGFDVSDYAKLVVELFGVDIPSTRNRLYKVMDELQVHSEIRWNEESESWEIVSSDTVPSGG
jgi:hypothetical protein